VSNFEESERISEKLLQLLSFGESRLSALRADRRLKGDSRLKRPKPPNPTQMKRNETNLTRMKANETNTTQMKRNQSNPNETKQTKPK
jgi:hypothetical protein